MPGEVQKRGRALPKPRAGEHALWGRPSKLQEDRTECHGSVVCEPLGDKNAKIESHVKYGFVLSGPLLQLGIHRSFSATVHLFCACPAPPFLASVPPRLGCATSRNTGHSYGRLGKYGAKSAQNQLPPSTSESNDLISDIMIF